MIRADRRKGVSPSCRDKSEPAVCVCVCVFVSMCVSICMMYAFVCEYEIICLQQGKACHITSYTAHYSTAAIKEINGNSDVLDSGGWGA